MCSHAHIQLVHIVICTPSWRACSRLFLFLISVATIIYQQPYLPTSYCRVCNGCRLSGVLKEKYSQNCTLWITITKFSIVSIHDMISFVPRHSNRKKWHIQLNHTLHWVLLTVYVTTAAVSDLCLSACHLFLVHWNFLIVDYYWWVYHVFILK